MGRRRRRRLCFLDMFLIILYHRYLQIFLIYSLYIPYICPSYVKYVFPCMFLNLWSQEKTSPYRKTTFIFFSYFTPFTILINSFMIFIKTHDFLNKMYLLGLGNRWPGPGGTLGGHRQYSALRHSIRTLQRYLKVSLVREKCWGQF